jgi:hypothetical protein
MVKNLPVLVNTEPGYVFTFHVRAQEIFDLNLLADIDFLALLVAKTTGRLMQIIADHMRVSSTWCSVCNEILATFFPPRIREEFLAKHVLDRFQSATEDLVQFNKSVSSNGAAMGCPDPAFLTFEFYLEAALDASSDGAAGQYILPRLYIVTSWCCVGLSPGCVGRR